MILPPATLGMLGGGQLGRFFVSAAHEMGYKVWVLDPDPHSPAGLIADRHLVAAYDDYVALDSLGSACAAVTTEFENVPADTLDYLTKCIPVHPAASAVAVCQNRIAEKTFLADHGLPHGPFAVIRGEDDVRNANAGLFPAILKVARFGYDGKGQASVADRDEALAAFQHFKGEPCVLEKMLALDYEVSVVLARDEAGNVRAFPAGENRHRNGILDVTIAPARASACLRDNAQEIAERPLRIGLSMKVAVDIRDQSGTAVSKAAHNTPHSTPVARTDVFDDLDQAAFERINAIVSANLGHAVSIRRLE